MADEKDILSAPEKGTGDTSEQAKAMEQLGNMPENPMDRPASELSLEELRKLLEQKESQASGEKRETRDAEKQSRREGFLKDLGDGITIGEPEAKLMARGQEVIGIYKDGKHVGDLFSDSNLTSMSDREFQDKAYELLNRGQMEVGCDKKTNDVLERNGILLRGDKLILGKDRRFGELDLYNNGENEKIELSVIDDSNVLLTVIEKGGKIIEYTITDGAFMPDSRRVKSPRQ